MLCTVYADDPTSHVARSSGPQKFLSPRAFTSRISWENEFWLLKKEAREIAGIGGDNIAQELEHKLDKPHSTYLCQQRRIDVKSVGREHATIRSQLIRVE